MRAPSHRTTKRIDHEAAIEEASRRLRPLLADVISWNDSSVPPKKKFKAAIGLLDGVLEDVEGALNKADYALHEAMKCRLNERAKHLLADLIPAISNVRVFIALARKAAMPELRQARPATGRHGRYKDLNASRDQTIAETVAFIREQFELSQEKASCIVSEALKRLVREHRRIYRALTKERLDNPTWIPADPAWIDECLMYVDNLWLSEHTVEDIASKYQTVRK